MKVLRRKIEDIIGPLAEEEIERFESSIHDSNGQETLINKITDKILHSRQYVINSIVLTQTKKFEILFFFMKRFDVAINEN